MRPEPSDPRPAAQRDLDPGAPAPEAPEPGDAVPGDAVPGDVRVLLCTAPPDRARDLARGVVERGLAACVNVLPGLTSVYRWEDAVQEDGESLLVVKTTARGLPALERHLLEAHPYDVPELVALTPAHVTPAYLAWLVGEVRDLG